ncbi:TSUP family transporter [Corynebacterium kutscheri]
MQRISGMGLGLIAGSVLSIVLGPVDGVLVINILAMINAVMIAATMYKNIDWHKFLIIAPCALFGSIPGAWVVSAVSVPVLHIVIGSLLLLALSLVTFGARFVPPATGVTPAVAAGTISGFTNTLAGIAGPVITVYAQAARWEHKNFAATLQPIFVVSALCSLIAKFIAGTGDISQINPWIFVASGLGMGIGLLSGGILARKVPLANARALALSIAGIGGVLVLLRGFIQLL